MTAVLMAGAVGYWLFRPDPSYDIQRVHPRLRVLQQPFQSVKSGYYMDGGSIGIEIIDQKGQREQFAIPSHLGEANPYTKVFVGALHDRKLGAVEITDGEHTKRMLVHILQDSPNKDAWDDFVLLQLTKRPVHRLRCLIHKWRGKYDKAGNTNF